MAKKKKQTPDNSGDIPAWFMTYSDVITLLMTFFILLLTFATNEPERFEKVKASMFGQGAATGLAGHKLEGIERDSYVERFRPRASRMVMTGSEMPPFEQTTVEKKSNGKMKGLDDPENLDLSQMFAIEIPIDELVNDDKLVTEKGGKIARSIAKQLRHVPFSCVMQLENKDLIERATVFTIYLYQVERIRPGQFGVSIIQKSSELSDPNKTRIVFERFMRED